MERVTIDPEMKSRVMSAVSTAIKEQAEGSLSGGAVVELLANGLLNYVKNPEKEYSYSNFNKFVKIADSFKNMDPYLAPILTKGIEKYKAAK